MSKKATTIVVTVLLINMIIGVLVFHLVMSIKLIDSLYFVVTIVTTIGFGDFNFYDAPIGIKIYGVFLMISGAGGYGFLISQIMDLLIKNRLSEVLGRKRYKRKWCAA